MPDDNFNQYCEDLLVGYNRRNTKTLTRSLSEKQCSKRYASLRGV